MSESRPTAVIVLAAGEGTRMKSTIPKVLHTIGGRSLVGHALRAARGIGPEHLAVVVRHERDRVAEHVLEHDPDVLIADQDEVKGTGRAVECALEALPQGLEGTVVVTYGDVPLLTSETLHGLVAVHEASHDAVTLITATLPDPTGYGRVLRDGDGAVAAIVEQKDATDEQRAIGEVNSGLYAFDAVLLRSALAEVGTDNVQGEKYLTDVIAVARARGLGVRAYPVDDLWQTEGVNDKVQLARLGAELNRRTVEAAMREGAIVIDPATTWIDADVTIGPDTVVHPGTQILGATSIGRDCVIGPDTTLHDCEVDDGASVVRTQAELAEIGPGATVGPFSYLRPGTRLGAGGKIGGFVETKNAQIADGAKVPHLSYCGDATVGPGANIGAGTIFANYDGVTKGHTTVGAYSFIGSNSVIVAPRTIGDGAYVAAGSAVVSDVDPGQLAVTRAQQRNIDGWVARRRAGTKTDEAARAAQAADAQPRAESTAQSTAQPSDEPTDEPTEPKDANG
ncbi:bifunctional UDP-N-acetylglucosamine pyrophosphorylase/glucosamine-1-phosphate N-acetyltransferase [Humibacillus xanthopallidus]|uniref:Bifunctional protein GlmU n=1 Tax=Humibacillus xanthopallidus TaxID=412689 RepID=A0A543PY91_9MICO|nr:bifunctional UDP-N-acetylglucosamine diphosphorylase/glucosamine-1-phosphate N-acetyltransferase GlmU [Humibacillus xanthopallidus]TQN49010.1 bifunctional UDP-N-acetylglucosamine pyrophosphorylase/glucosamine-1-phosphate N-acetyltransferase [Humibacillus xanthopallidus]